MVLLPQMPGSGEWGGMGVRPQVGLRAQRKGKEERRETEANFIEITSRYQSSESRIFIHNDFHPNR